jgi:uncharacterized spore protein YtfJ
MTTPDTTKDATVAAEAALDAQAGAEASAAAAAAAATDAARRANNLLERLAKRVGSKASVRAVFGEPVVAEGVTVIPVATVAFGFGGGTGRETGPAKTGEGLGGGGGVTARPLGYIEISGGAAVFKPIRDPRRDVLASLAAVAASTATVRMARVLSKRRRR